MKALVQRLSHRPILLTTGLLMTAIVLLGVVSMLSSVFIAETTEGMATAINQSGSLRMQSYRIGVALADASIPAPTRARTASDLAKEFETRLVSPRLMDAIPGSTNDEVARAYDRITRRWELDVQPRLADQIRRLAGDEPRNDRAPPPKGYLAEVDAFVAEIDALVRLLEENAERRIDILRWIQAVSLACTVAVVLVAMVLVSRRVIRPLAELLACADQARRGDFTGRARFTGRDELGRLGSAMNSMAEDLSQIYGALEQRVNEKTRDLARSNLSLDLLYRTSKTLNEEPASEQLLRQVLVDIQHELGTGAATLCLRNQEPGQQGTLLVTTRSEAERTCPCSEQGCRACLEPDSCRSFSVDLGDTGRRWVTPFPVVDRDQRFGLLLIDLPEDRVLTDWHRPLLTTLAGHIGTAINLQQRMHESRRLVLHEERSIIARELHDSLAQSLSYLKIQITRLTAVLEEPGGDRDKLRAVLDELREGTGSAYRQLRELLTTFRLKMDDRGLTHALEATVQELRTRSTIEIVLDNRLPSSLLTPNEEIHVLQIVREALSNVIRHARAQRADVRLRLTKAGVQVEIADDGRGLVTTKDRARHYGMNIMRERALSLGGKLQASSGSGGGTRVQLRFRHRSADGPDGTAAGFLGTMH